MRRRIIRIILMSLLTLALAGCGDNAVGEQTRPADASPEVTAAPTEEPPEETASQTEEPPEETASQTEEPPEETASPTEEPPEETAASTEEPPEETASQTEEPPEETVPTAPTPTAAPTATPAPAAKPTATPTAAPTPTQKPAQPPADTVYNAPYPSAPGSQVAKSGGALIDYSNAKDGYVMVKWTGESVKIAVQVAGPNNAEKYTYYLRSNGDYDVLPLSDGNGTYKFTVLKNISGTKYSQVLAASVTADLADSLAPFLRPNQYVNYTAGSEAVKKARELVQGAADNLAKVKAVYNWVVTSLSYDYDKAKTVQSGYLPVVDQVMAAKKGICFDYAALMSSMLRSQGVPVKLVVGYTSTGEYHAWINVWSEKSGWMDSVIYFDGKSWKLMDPTFASSGKQSKSIMDYIGNTANYKERFAY